VPPENAKELIISDPRGNVFDAQGNPIQAELYLDIVGAEVYVAETSSVFRIILDGDVPSELNEPDIVLEWDFYIDTTMDVSIGGVVGFLSNDIDPNYLLRVIMASDWIVAEIRDLKSSTGNSVSVDYLVTGEIISFSVPASVLPLGRFNFTVAACKWLTGELVAASKAPNQGHYNMPSGYVYIKPGLPTKHYTTANAVIWYNEGNEERAKWCAEAFEAAYSYVVQTLQPLSAPSLAVSEMTAYVYVSQADLVAGLQEYNRLSLDAALIYGDGGAPRPVVVDKIFSGALVFHIPPDFDWRDIYHQQVLAAMDRLC